MGSSKLTQPGSANVLASSKLGAEHYPKILVNSYDGVSCDPASRWRVSEPETVFSSKLLGSDLDPLFWEDDQISGSTTSPTTPTEAKPYTDLASINVTAGVFVRQTYRRFNYLSGTGLLIKMSAVLELASGTKTGCERRLGYFDDNNGLFFESDAGVIGVTVRSNNSGTPADTTVVQANWNVDNLDGSGDASNPSGILADWTKGQVFVIDLEWLSLGRVRFGVEINGVIKYVHYHNTANVSAIPFMSTSNLPLRFELISTTDSGVCSMRVICSTVVVEGGTQDVGVVHHASNLGAAVVTDTENVFFAVLGLRLKTTRVGTTIKIINVSIQIQTASEFLMWVLIWNPTVAGTFTYVNLSNSALQKALGATANTVTGGTHMAGGYLESGGGSSGGSSGGGLVRTSLIMGVDIAGTGVDEVVLCVMPIGGVSAMSVEGGIIWRELS